MKDTLSILHPGVETAPVVSTSAAAARALRNGLAPRLGGENALRGRRLALLDNTKVNAAELLNAIATRLQAHGIAEVRSWRKRHAGESGASVIPDIVKWRPDLVLTGLGD